MEHAVGDLVDGGVGRVEFASDLEGVLVVVCYDAGNFFVVDV